MSEPPAPKFEPVGPTVEADVGSLISRYGKAAVQAAVKKLTKAKRGRKPEKDWPLLAPLLKQDAVDWLENRDPIQLRSHYAVAQAYAAEHPGHNQTATVIRITKKLSSRRRWFFLVMAWEQSRSGRPFTDCLRTLEALADEDEKFASLINFARNDLECYRERQGEPPSDMAMDDIERENANSRMGFAQYLIPTGGMFGASKGAPQKPPFVNALGGLLKPTKS